MIVDCAYYKDRQRQNDKPLSLERARECMDTGMGFVWLGMKDPTPEEVAEATRAFDVPELAVEEAVRGPPAAEARRARRPLLRRRQDRLVRARPRRRSTSARSTSSSARGYVITVRHGEAADLKPARRHLEEEHPDLFDAGPAAVVWAILDQVVDDYEPVVGGIDDDIEEVEQAVFEGGAESTERIYFLKREVIEFHRAVAPLLAAAGGDRARGLPADARGRFAASSATSPADARRIDEQVNSQRELLTSILEANLSLISVRQNQVVQAISAWAAIIAVPTFFASIWGMNFEHMPELG